MEKRDRLSRLAKNIDTLVEKDDRQVKREQEIEETRRRAAMELHGACAIFVASVNRLLSKTALELSPQSFTPELFREEGQNIFQINVRGRILQIEFESTPSLVSTENFRVPHVLEGSVRCFNQDLLDRSTIEEQFLFFCLEKSRNSWRFFNARTYHTGMFDQDYLISLMEQLV
ncbi:MAG: hypothetical protein ABIZ80_07270 [Bryobacteraceae bacterium]